MVRKRKDVTDAELAILQVLWQHGRATIRQLTETLYPQGSESEYATVKKLLARLEGKGFVHRDRSEVAHAFSATVSQDELIGRRLQAVADHLCGGSRTPLLLHLLETERLTPEQRTQLRKHLDELADPKPSAKGKGDARVRRNQP